jgi:hypothetical protein
MAGLEKGSASVSDAEPGVHSGTRRRLDLAEHSFTNEEEFVGADSDFSVASGPWPALVGDQALPNSTSDNLVGDVKVGSEVSHRPPCLRS